MSEAHDAIRAALATLNTKNDDHWTENALPRLEALGLKGVTRQDVTAAAPQFTRMNAVVQVVKQMEAPAPAAPVVNTDQEDYDALSLECADAEKKLADAKAFADVARAEMQALETKRDAIVKRLDKARPKNENMLGIRAVLARSNEARANNAEIAKELRKVGVTAALLQAGSPLDRAMARKRGFGLQRPTAPGQPALQAGAK
jgi:hypothetical protein